MTSAYPSYIFCIQVTTKRIRQPSILGALFTSQARQDVLELLFLNTPKRYYLREIASLTQHPVRAIQRELARLEAGGLLTGSAEGNRKYYQANRESPIFPELKALMIKTVGLGDLLRKHLRKSESSIRVAFLFGSYARGSEDATSDIDLMVIGEITGRALARLIAPAREILRREVNAVILPSSELRRRLAEEGNFMRDVLEEPKVFLIGGEDELSELAKGRLPQTP
ncbi:MAG: nucleotidyltransferase domain-containing protein [Anaerolineales bacterium]